MRSVSPTRSNNIDYYQIFIEFSDSPGILHQKFARVEYGLLSASICLADEQKAIFSGPRITYLKGFFVDHMDLIKKEIVKRKGKNWNFDQGINLFSAGDYMAESEGQIPESNQRSQASSLPDDGLSLCTFPWSLFSGKEINIKPFPQFGNGEEDVLEGFHESSIPQEAYVAPAFFLLLSLASFVVANSGIKITSAYGVWFVASAFGFSVSSASLVCPIFAVTFAVLALASCLLIRQKRATGSFLPGIFSSCLPHRHPEMASESNTNQALAKLDEPDNKHEMRRPDL